MDRYLYLILLFFIVIKWDLYFDRFIINIYSNNIMIYFILLSNKYWVI